MFNIEDFLSLDGYEGTYKDKCKEYAEYCKKIIAEVDRKK